MKFQSSKNNSTPPWMPTKYLISEEPSWYGWDLVDGNVYIDTSGAETSGPLHPGTHEEEPDKVQLQDSLQAWRHIAGGGEGRGGRVGD